MGKVESVIPSPVESVGEAAKPEGRQSSWAESTIQTSFQTSIYSQNPRRLERLPKIGITIPNASRDRSKRVGGRLLVVQPEGNCDIHAVRFLPGELASAIAEISEQYGDEFDPRSIVDTLEKLQSMNASAETGMCDGHSTAVGD